MMDIVLYATFLFKLLNDLGLYKIPINVIILHDISHNADSE